MFAQDFGNNSMCIIHKGAWRAEMNGNATNDPRVKETCHQYSCSGGLQMIINGKPFQCNSGLAKIQTKQIQGEIICPNPNIACRDHTIPLHPDNVERRDTASRNLKFYIHFTPNFHQLQDHEKLHGGIRWWSFFPDGNNSIYCRQSNCKRYVMCGGVKNPDKYVGECYHEHNNRLYRYYNNGSGIPSAGYVLLVDAINTKTCSGSTAAYASSCLMDEETDRPILGYVNVCPGKMRIKYPEDRNARGIFIHEIGHALVISSII
ncbi:unnamed protein product [Schistosoma rodhaini]|uniref:Leishmanolysin-like peptidase n=1 Tax=Schistosoma rodhaini TaxID=6188 RepID=A0AA85FXI0_9TREM|nr:unnamed protein product [Schistosoma rodhaini]